jgi:uncharacterized protein
VKRTTNKTLIIGFGSQASGKVRSGSDFDIGVLSDKILTLAERTRLCGRLAKKLNINEDTIDLVDLRTASPLLLYEVAKKGKLIEGSDFDFIRFKVRAWKVYQDTAKFRRLGEKMVKKYVQRIHSQKT